VAGRAAQARGQTDHARRIQPGGVGRREIVGEQHRRDVGTRDARLPLPGQLGDDPVANVSDVGDALGHQAAQRGEQVDELLRGLDRGDRSRRAGVDALLDRREQPAVARQAGGGR
jgi:hypothetical protein